MIPVRAKPTGSAGSPFQFDIAASGWASVPTVEFAGLRAQVSALYGDTLSASVLKQADLQSIAALLALRQAIGPDGGGPASPLRATDEGVVGDGSLEHWGLIAAPRCPGRKRISESLTKFRDQGAWSTSPHLIPNCSLHSQSGLLSQALRLHGPNFGAGGMPGAEGEAVWAAIALLHGERLPGLWLVFTGWDRETLATDDARCQAVALGLRRAAAVAGSGTFTVSLLATDAPPLSLESLGEAIRHRHDSDWSLGQGALTIHLQAARMEAA